MSDPRFSDPIYASGYLDGITNEQSRIIKLLEGFDDSCLWRQVEWSPDAYEGFNMQELIDLIKGQQK